MYIFAHLAIGRFLLAVLYIFFPQTAESGSRLKSLSGGAGGGCAEIHWREDADACSDLKAKRFYFFLLYGIRLKLFNYTLVSG